MLVSDCYPKHYQMLHDSLKPVQERKEALKSDNIAEREGEIRERRSSLRGDKWNGRGEIIGILRQSERKLTEQLKRVTDAKLEILQLNFMAFSTLVKIRSLSSVLSWT